MPLQKQKIPLLLNQGLDQKTDSKSRAIGSLDTLENGVWNKRNKISKRNGHTKLTTAGAANKLGTRGNELLAFTADSVYSYNDSLSTWQDKGDCIGTTLTNEPLLRPQDELFSSASAKYGNYAVYAYSTYGTSTGNYSVYTIVLDHTTGEVVYPLTRHRTSTTDIYGNLRCMALGTKIYFFYSYGYTTTSSYVRGLYIDTTAIASGWSADTLLTSTAGSYLPGTRFPTRFDVAPNETDSEIMLSYITTTPTLAVRVVTAALSAGAETVITGTTNILTQGDVAMCRVSDTKYFIGFTNDVSGNPRPAYVSVDQNKSVLLSVADPGSAYNGPDATNWYSKSLISYNGDVYYFSNKDYALGFGGKNDTSENDICAFKVQDTIGTVTSFNDEKVIGCALAGGAFQYGGDVYFPVVRASSYNGGNEARVAMLLKLEEDSTVGNCQAVARWNNGLAYSEFQDIAQVINTTGDKYEYLMPRFTELTASGSSLTPDGETLCRVTIDMSAVNFRTADLDNTTYIAGAMPQIYDGTEAVEYGFNWAPSFDAVSNTGGTGSSPGTGSYSYTYLYEWRDANGKLYRSAPAKAKTGISVTSPAVPQITMHTMTVTATGENNPIKLVLYRTLDAGTIYYRHSEHDNDPTVREIVVDDNKSDNSIDDQEILYTTGGVLANDPCPPCSYIIPYKNRLWVKSDDERNVLWYTKEAQSWRPPQFNVANVLNVDPVGGPITALGVVDDKLAIFKKDRFYMTYGDGPSDTGFNGSFQDPQYVSSDVGCSNPDSIVRTPSGLMFQSDKGIYLLDSNLAPAFVGDRVDDFKSSTITAAVLMNDVNQVRFSISSNSMLVYDYYFDQWSTFTNLGAKDMVVLENGQFYLLRDNAEVFKDDATVWDDDAESYALKIGSSWISLDQLVGYQRFYQMMFMGENMDTHQIKVDIGYDFKNTYDHTATFNPSGNIANDESYIFRVYPKTQKCQAFRFLLTETNQADTEQGFEISAVGLLVGAKGKLARQRTEQSMGVS